MACPEKSCDLTAVTATLSGSLGTFTFTEYVGTGDLVEFGETNVEVTAQYSNTRKKSIFSGTSIPTMQVTLNTFYCDTVFKALWPVHINNANACWGSLVVNDPCCDIVRLKDVRIVSMKLSNITDGQRVSPIVLEGIPIT